MRVFLYVPIIPYRSFYCCPRQLDRGPSDGSCSVVCADLIKDNLRLNALAVLGLAFSLSLIFARVADGR